ALRPAGDLQFEKPRGLTQHYFGYVHSVQRSQAVNESLADAAPEICVVRIFDRDLPPEHQPLAAFHDEEDRPDDGRIVAQQECFGGLRKNRMDRPQHVVLAGHVVRLWRHWSKGWPPQHVLALACCYQISEVGMPTRELPDR